MQHRMLISGDTKASEVIEENLLSLLMLEYFEIPLGIKEKTISQLAIENSIEPAVFLAIVNLYNGINPASSLIDSISDVLPIINFLKKSHRHYLIEKFPILTEHLSEISKLNTHGEIELLIKFFDNYLDEVSEHLRYEDDIVFPYIINLTKNTLEEPTVLNTKFSISEYRSHHDDIEEKLNDLKNLLIRYLPSQNDTVPRRKLLFALNELESDLHAHSRIEDIILIPIVERLEISINAKK